MMRMLVCSIKIVATRDSLVLGYSYRSLAVGIVREVSVNKQPGDFQR
jgi:hypothetical protein